MEPKKLNFFQKALVYLNKPRAFSNSVPSSEVAYFLENLSTLVSSGYDIFSAVSVISRDTKLPVLRKKLDTAIQLLSDGLPLWKVLLETNIVSENITSLLRVGEESGRLAEHLHVIAQQESRDRMFREKIQSAMMYPLFVCIVMLVVGVGVSWFILPKLAQIFSSLRADLPFSTRMLIGLGKFLNNYGPVVIPSIFILLFASLYIFFFNKKTKHIGFDMMLRIPGLSGVFRDIEISRLGFLMSSLLSVGITVPESLSIVSDSTIFRKYKKAYDELANLLDEGKTFREAFMSSKQASISVPAVVQQLMFAGEESNSLPEVFSKIYSLYESRIEQSTKNLSVLLEPILLVVIAAGVFFVAIAVITPIYSLVGNLQSPKKNIQPRVQIATPTSNVSGQKAFPESYEKTTTQNKKK